MQGVFAWHLDCLAFLHGPSRRAHFRDKTAQKLRISDKSSYLLVRSFRHAYLDRLLSPRCQISPRPLAIRQCAADPSCPLFLAGFCDPGYRAFLTAVTAASKLRSTKQTSAVLLAPIRLAKSFVPWRSRHRVLFPIRSLWSTPLPTRPRIASCRLPRCLRREYKFISHR